MNQFDAGFVKAAEEQGLDGAFLAGYIDHHVAETEKWASIIDQIEEATGDKAYRFKLAEELYQLSNKEQFNSPLVQYILSDDLQKEANFGEMGNQMLDWAGKGNNSTMAGGGIGGILGLILGKLLFNSPGMGALLGGLGGAGLGHFKGQDIIGGLRGMLNKGPQEEIQNEPVAQPGQEPKPQGPQTTGQPIQPGQPATPPTVMQTPQMQPQQPQAPKPMQAPAQPQGVQMQQPSMPAVQPPQATKPPTP